MERNSRLLRHTLFLALFFWSSIGRCGEIHDAARVGDLDKIKKLIESDPRLISSKDENGQTPLHVAARVAAPQGRKDIVEFLLAQGADVNLLDKAGNSPLLSAIHKDWVYNDLIVLLISKGADVNVKNANGVTPLSITASMRQMKLTEMLLAKGADVNARIAHGGTVLQSAAACDSLESVKLLLASKANINAKDDDGDTPLHYAAANGLKAMAAFLISSGAAVNAKNNFGQTPLEKATNHPPLPHSDGRAYVEVAELLRHPSTAAAVFSESQLRVPSPKATFDPSVRHHQTIQFPTKFEIKVIPEEQSAILGHSLPLDSPIGAYLSVALDEKDRKPIDITIGLGMTTGTRTTLFVYPEGEPRPKEPWSTGYNTDHGGAVFIHRKRNDPPFSPKKYPYIVEMKIEFYETDQLPDSLGPEGGNFKVLHSEMLKEIIPLGFQLQRSLYEDPPRFQESNPR